MDTRRQQRTGTGFRAGLSRAGTQRGQKPRPGTGNHSAMHVVKAAPRPLPPDLLRRIENDPLFMVVTLDGTQWIDPFSGEPVPVGPQGRASAARVHLAESGGWRNGNALPLGQLETERWRLDLTRLLPTEPRLRIFLKDNRGWINPFSGEVVQGVERPDGKLTPRTLWQMSQKLAVCPHARAGRMFDMQELLNRGRAYGAAQAAQEPTPPTPRAEHQALSEDMAQAQSVQQHMLSEMPKPPGYELAVHLSPHAGVAGDFYEVTTLRDGRIFIALGDVSGHGMQAALVVATALKTIRFVARSTSDLTELVCRFNDEIKPDLMPGQFITLFAAVLDPDNRVFSCLRAGHQPAVLVNLARDDVMRRLGRRGMAIGLATGAVFAQSLHQVSMQLEAGDIIVQSTDGALEAMNGEDVQFGESRYLASVLSRYESSAQELVDGVAEDVRAYVEERGVGDDLTVLALAVLPSDDTALEHAPPQA
jgi:serine phosphatase RsbU (regulator of sigma subunit)